MKTPVEGGASVDSQENLDAWVNQMYYSFKYIVDGVFVTITHNGNFFFVLRDSCSFTDVCFIVNQTMIDILVN